MRKDLGKALPCEEGTAKEGRCSGSGQVLGFWSGGHVERAQQRVEQRAEEAREVVQVGGLKGRRERMRQRARSRESRRAGEQESRRRGEQKKAMARLFVRSWTMDGIRTSAIPVRILRNAPQPIAIPTYNPNA